MTIEVVWDNPEKTAILYTLTDKWDWEELFTIREDVFAMRESVPHTVDIFGDIRQSAAIPSGNIIGNARRMLLGKPSNRGIIVIITHNHFIKSIINVVHRIYRDIGGKGVYVAASLEEARAIALQHRSPNPE